MSVDNFFDRNIYNWLAECHHVRVFINIEFFFRFRNNTCCVKKIPKGREKSKKCYCPKSKQTKWLPTVLIVQLYKIYFTNAIFITASVTFWILEC